ncbi:MAG: hypothetical protein AMXMBFR23_26460 [Chloroflexota bacterium]
MLPRSLFAASMLVIALALGCDGAPRLRAKPVLAGVTFDRPVEVAAYPDGRLLVAEQGGTVWLADDEGERALLLDLAGVVDDERGEGLLSVALDPEYEANGHVWAFYFADDPMRSDLVRYTVRGGPADPSSALVVLSVAQPGYNQNGGAIRFADDGTLVLSLGDGSASTDPFEQGQDTTTLLATVVRLDVSAASEDEPYRVPPDNPFVHDARVRPEIFAYGFRNPFRMDIDPATGAVWLGDVGASTTEEVNRIVPGGNYGWSVVEGDRCLDATDCDRTGLIPPVATYSHTDDTCAVIGGVVYRGEAIEALDGHYLYADMCSGTIFALDTDDGATPVEVGESEGVPVTFGRDADGEVLVADYAGGGIYRLVAE